MRCPIFSNTATDNSKDHLDYLSINELTIGMTVVELDKPWVDSEFLMHGFRIKDEIDIDDLRAECNHVYIKKSEDLSEETMARGHKELNDFSWGKLPSGLEA